MDYRCYLAQRGFYNMNEQVIIQTIIEQIKSGAITIDQVPELWRVKVQDQLDKIAESTPTQD